MFGFFFILLKQQPGFSLPHFSKLNLFFQMCLFFFQFMNITPHIRHFLRNVFSFILAFFHLLLHLMQTFFFLLFQIIYSCRQIKFPISGRIIIRCIIFQFLGERHSRLYPHLCHSHRIIINLWTQITHEHLKISIFHRQFFCIFQTDKRLIFPIPVKISGQKKFLIS